MNLAIWVTFSWSATALCNSVGIDVNHISVSGLYRCVAYSTMVPTTLQWRHNDHDGVSNHQVHGCLLNRLFRRRSKKTSNLRVTGLCVGNSPGPVNSPHKGPVTRKMFPFDDVIMMHHFRYMYTQSLFRSNRISDLILNYLQLYPYDTCNIIWYCIYTIYVDEIITNMLSNKNTNLDSWYIANPFLYTIFNTSLLEYGLSHPTTSLDRITAAYR